LFVSGQSVRALPRRQARAGAARFLAALKVFSADCDKLSFQAKRTAFTKVKKETVLLPCDGQHFLAVTLQASSSIVLPWEDLNEGSMRNLSAGKHECRFLFDRVWDG
jgi:hypothetical protein